MKRTELKPRRTSKRQSRSEFASDSLWREAVIEWLGERCSVPGCFAATWPVQIDHIIPRAQGGLSDLHNGWPLCVLHHDSKTAGELKIAPEWLTREHIAYLGEHGWVQWITYNDEPGQPVGNGWRHFSAATT